MIGQCAKPNRSAGGPAGFTLVELLVVIMVITILAGIVLGGIGMARDAARQAKTEALIAKLHPVIMQKYESYATYRVPIDTTGLPARTAAELRLKALRIIMKYEMPDRWEDVLDTDPSQLSDIEVSASLPGGGTVTRKMKYPALSYVYAAYKQSHEVLGEFSPAECLYMIVAVGDPEAMENFRQNEIGNADDKSGDTFPEFLDGWGRPIMFLRWAPGFSSEFGGLSEIQTGNPQVDHDPFDPQGLQPDAFHLIPLIYSGGADQKYDIDLAPDARDLSPTEAPYVSQLGQPADDPNDADGELNHADNVHNHAM
ncbi:MAG: type II secretion system protein [Candidatus Nealsonbacteria bacterium]|nr:type II secretion system protein [Candidatus Nealsonbacteria bacterium]